MSLSLEDRVDGQVCDGSPMLLELLRTVFGFVWG
jgi:hypothetical protein